MARTARWSVAILACLPASALGGCGDNTQEVAETEPFTTASSGSRTATSRGETDTTSSSDGSTSRAETLDPDSTSQADSAQESSTGDTEQPTCAAPPPPDPGWLSGQLDDVVGSLTGAMPLPTGATLSERSTAGNREAAAAYIHSTFEALGLETQRHDYSASGSNVVARLGPTTTSTGVVVVGAHYDSVPGSPGANDNATGVALLVALARHLSEVECRSYELQFVAFDEEEIGLIGSDAFAQLLVDQGTNVISVHTIDQMGWDQDGDRTIELERADEGLFEFYEGAAADLGITLTATQTGFTDHVSFRTYGFAAIGLTEEFVSGDTTPHYHLSSDTYETVDLDYLASTATLMNAAFASFIDAS